MRERLRLALAAFFYYSGLVRFMLWRKQRSGQNLTILNYHRATGNNLRRQLLFLHHHYRIMHLEDALEELYTSKPGDQKARDSRLPLVLTFDDGYLDNYTCAFQLVQELQIPMTIFVIPGYIESGKFFWWLADDYLVDHANVEQVVVEDQTYHLAQSAERKALAQLIDKRTRLVSSVAEREAFLEQIQVAMQTPLPSRKQVGRQETALPINWDEVREMEESGLVSFGCHTLHHPVLADLTDEEELRREVSECRRVLEDRLGHPVRAFCYPVGKIRHIGDKGIAAVKAAGYQWAVTTIEDVNTAQTDPYLLNRLPGDIDSHWLVMAAELAGLLGNMSRFRKKYARFFKR